MRDLKNSNFIFTKNNLHKYNNQYSVLTINSPIPNQDQILDYISKILSSLPEQMAHNVKLEMLNIILINDVNSQNIVHPIEGSYNKNSIIIKFNNSFTTEDFIKLFANQIAHIFLESCIKNIDDNNENMWFFEGFSEYFAHKILLHAKLKSSNEYMKYYNNSLEKYYLKGVPTQIPMQKIGIRYWQNPMFREIALLRGVILAQELDNIIMNYTNNNHSLEKMIKEIYISSKNININPTAQNIANILSESMKNITQKNYSEFLKRVLLNGTFLKHSQSIRKDFHFKEVKSEVVNFGFNVIDTLTYGKIFDVEKSSIAYHKGLRDNQNLLSFSHFIDQNNIEIYIQNTSNKMQLIKFEPLKSEVLVPQYMIDCKHAENL